MKITLKALIILLFCLITYCPNASRVLSAETSVNSGEKYTFSSDWFTYDIPTWTRVLREMKDKPNISYLEVGTYEGRSFFWVMEHILTHPSSKALAIDTFDKFGPTDPEKVFRENIRRSGRSKNIEVIKGSSQRMLRSLKPSSFDLIYIDGDHKSKGVIMDAILSWDLLKEGGILIFDDYKLDYDLPMEMRPEFAIDVFQSLFPDEIQILVNDYQLIVRKSKSQCIEAMGFIKRLETPLVCSRLGSYVYYWKPQKLYEASTYREIALSQKDIPIIEKTLLGRRLGFRLEVDHKERDDYTSLLTRLGLKDIAISAK